MTACEAYLIDSTARTITRVTYEGVEGLRALVGGHIELAHMWPNRDVLYVDEEGDLKSPRVHFHLLERPDQHLAGNGVLVGRELDDEEVSTAPPTMTLEGLRRRVLFLGKIR